MPRRELFVVGVAYRVLVPCTACPAVATCLPRAWHSWRFGLARLYVKRTAGDRWPSTAPPQARAVTSADAC
jgi:hypothetical protein